MLRRVLLPALGWLLLSGCARSLARPPAPAPPRPPGPVVTFAAVGDLMLDREAGRQIERRGSAYPFEQIGALLSDADVAFGNLECPLSESAAPVAKRFSFRARPAAAACLLRGGFDLLSLANNHTMDCGRAGLVETMRHLADAGLRWCGAGDTQAEAEGPAVLAVKGLRIAFVGFCDFLPEGTFLRDDRPTIAFASEAAVRRAVARARAEADIVVASFHWGIEYESRPTTRQVALARAAVAAGADLVLGHHPHVLQGLEVVAAPAPRNGRPSLVAYSLGNFLFDRREGRALQSVILRCRFSRRGLVAADVVPVQIDGIRPRPASPAEADAILGRLALLSAERHTQLVGGRVALDKTAGQTDR